MDNWVIELIRQVPSAAAVIGTVFLFLRHIEKENQHQADRAKEKAVEERAHQIDINSLWANTIKEAMEQTDKTAVTTTQMIVDKLGDMNKDIQEKYEKMRITQDLIDAVNGLRKEKEKKQ
jgi:hypothetical protein